MTVVRLIDEQKSPSTLSWNMVQLLEESIEDIKDNKLPNKGLVLFLDNSQGGFVIDWKKAGIINSEALAMIELFKCDLTDMLREITHDSVD